MTNNILCYSHCAYSYIQYINQQMHLMTSIKLYMFRHKRAIRKQSFRSKVYKWNKVM